MSYLFIYYERLWVELWGGKWFTKIRILDSSYKKIRALFIPSCWYWKRHKYIWSQQKENTVKALNLLQCGEESSGLYLPHTDLTVIVWCMTLDGVNLSQWSRRSGSRLGHVFDWLESLAKIFEGEPWLAYSSLLGRSSRIFNTFPLNSRFLGHFTNCFWNCSPLPNEFAVQNGSLLVGKKTHQVHISVGRAEIIEAIVALFHFILVTPSP